MVQCINCNVTLRKNNLTKICPPCKNDDTVTITFTNARKLYKLTESDIDDAKLYAIKVNNRGTTGRKFLIKDIEILAKKVFDALPPDNKQKIKNLENLENKQRRSAIKKYLSDKYTESFTSTVGDLIELCSNGSITYNDTIKDIDIRFTAYKLKQDFQYRLKKYVSEQFSEKSLSTYAANNELLNLSSNDISEYFKNNNKISFLYMITQSRDYESFAANDLHINFTEVDIDRSDLQMNLKIIAHQIIYSAVHKLYRTDDLIKKLTEKGLALRGDSKLCNWYIAGGIPMVKSNYVDQQINSVDDIVNTMEEMNYYYTKTNYSSINKALIRANSHKVQDWDSEDDNSYDSYDRYHQNFHWELTKPINEINLAAKIQTLRENLGADYNDMPSNVKKTYDSIYRKN
ncbi:MAG: hypothetical protein Hyperionvirus1_35 [Hyperionvirus sp.]|uniref:Uncharacterized protein n=1 Tax=Hyperionvirus sp. TaxID=2487770 RepID=A0A3G5A5D7_9VIRU|nr:MAG: hypothetical protein Hyperionvirus1_35 [Hyperionvirus sp.]